MTDVQDSRFIREFLLKLLSHAYGSTVGAGLGMSLHQIMGGLRRSRLSVSASQVSAAMNSLIGKKLVEMENDPAMDENIYRLTANGYDFFIAGCPWEKLDPYTGKLA